MDIFDYIQNISNERGSVLIMLVGCPHSGKTHLSNYLKHSFDYTIYSASDNFKRIHAIKSKDSITEIDKDDIYDAMHEEVRDLLNKGETVVYDSTNVYSKWRKRLLRDVGNASSYNVCIILNTPLHICLEKNLTCDEPVSEEAMIRMHQAARKIPPNVYEGFDLIFPIDQWERI